MKYTVDRIEEGVAVLENELSEHINIPLSELPAGIRDGSVIVYNNDHYELDLSSEEKRRAEMFAKQQRLLNRNKRN